jgi:hypothetical protein
MGPQAEQQFSVVYPEAGQVPVPKLLDDPNLKSISCDTWTEPDTARHPDVQAVLINQPIKFKRNFQIVLHLISRHEDVLSIHLPLSFETGPSYVHHVAQSPL